MFALNLSHPSQPSEYPYCSKCGFLRYVRLGSFSTLSCTATGTASSFTSTCILIGILTPPLPGTGWLGLPFISLASSQFHLSSSGLLLIAQAFTTPSFVPIMVSVVRAECPSQIPSFQRHSNLLSLFVPSESSLYQTTSPKGTTSILHLAPFILSYAVLPSLSFLYFVTTIAAHLTNHCRMSASASIFFPILYSIWSLNTLTYSLILFPASSTLPLACFSPTGDPSGIVSPFLSAMTAFLTASIAAS